MYNRSVTALTLTAQGAATSNGPDIDNSGGRHAVVVVDITVAGGSPTVTFTVQGKDDASGKYYTILATTSLTGTGTTVLRIGPGITASANAAVNDILPKTFRVAYVVGGTTPAITATVGVSMIG